jgi:hypothetical protein
MLLLALGFGGIGAAIGFMVLGYLARELFWEVFDFAMQRYKRRRNARRRFEYRVGRVYRGRLS